MEEYILDTTENSLLLESSEESLYQNCRPDNCNPNCMPECDPVYECYPTESE